MNLLPMIDAPLAVQLHILSALPALLLGPLALFRRRRDRWHKVVGRAWAAAMFALALSSLFIHDNPIIGPFSPIHALSILTFWGLFTGIRAIRRGDRRGHAQAMRGLYVQALILASVLTLLPGRRISTALFPQNPEIGLSIAVLCGLILALLAYRLPIPQSLSQHA
jgi:uncharacterized membrane protein